MWRSVWSDGVSKKARTDTFLPSRSGAYDCHSACSREVSTVLIKMKYIASQLLEGRTLPSILLVVISSFHKLGPIWI